MPAEQHPASVDDYIAASPEIVRPILTKLRAMIHAAVPGGGESIRYGMPAIRLADGYHLYFAAWKRHVGMYPIATLDGELERDLAGYRTGKDSIRFPLSAPIPYPLIDRLIGAVAAGHADPAKR
jgi:uncharacterized protein YdhG (YjbR/CyaY superfamily)